MDPIKNDHCNKVFRLEGCFDLHAFNDGLRTSICYEVTPDDLAKMAETGKLYITLHAGRSIPPISVSTEEPYFKHKDMKCIIAYEATILKGFADKLLVWNCIDAQAPQLLKTDKGTYRRCLDLPTVLVHIKEVKNGEYVLLEHPADGRGVLVRVDDIEAGAAGETIFEIPTAMK